MYEAFEIFVGLFAAVLIAVLLFSIAMGFLVPFLLFGVLVWLTGIARSARTH